MVTVNDDLVVGDIGDGIDDVFSGLRALSFELHADLDLVRKLVLGLDMNEIGIVVAEGTHQSLVRTDPLYRRLAALQFGFDAGAADPLAAIPRVARV
jgi:hypothetical protein